MGFPWFQSGANWILSIHSISEPPSLDVLSSPGVPQVRGAPGADEEAQGRDGNSAEPLREGMTEVLRCKSFDMEVAGTSSKGLAMKEVLP